MKYSSYLFLVSFFVLACSYREEKFPQPPNEQLSSNPNAVAPAVLNFNYVLENGVKAKCFSCHLPHNSSSGVNLNFYKELIDSKVIVPGDPEISTFYQVVKDNYMPSSGEPLTDFQKKIIYDWILAGAKL